jgi:hypothetical protein
MADQDFDLEEKLMQVAFSEIRETSPEIFQKLGRTFQDGEVLFREGERSTELVMIVAGTCKITKGHGPDEKVLAYLRSGEILGEMSHFDDQPRSATATAVGELSVLWMTRENFGMVFELHHKWTLYLLTALARRIHSTFGRLVAAHDRAPTMVHVAAVAPPAPKPSPEVPATAAVTPPAAVMAMAAASRAGEAAIAPATAPGAMVPPMPASLGTPDKVEKFYAGVRAAVAAKPDAFAGLRQAALARAGGVLDQHKRINDLFAYAEARLRAEGLLR